MLVGWRNGWFVFPAPLWSTLLNRTISEALLHIQRSRKRSIIKTKHIKKMQVNPSTVFMAFGDCPRVRRWWWCYKQIRVAISVSVYLRYFWITTWNADDTYHITYFENTREIENRAELFICVNCMWKPEATMQTVGRIRVMLIFIALPYNRAETATFWT